MRAATSSLRARSSIWPTSLRPHRSMPSSHPGWTRCRRGSAAWSAMRVSWAPPSLARIEFLCADVPDLDGILARLQRKELIGTDNDRFSAERGQFRFEQAVVRQVAYVTLSRRARKERHLADPDHLSARVAESMGDISIGVGPAPPRRHGGGGFRRSRRAELSAALAALLVVAGERAARLGSYAAAVTSFRNAAGRMPEGAERAEARLKAAQQRCHGPARRQDRLRGHRGAAPTHPLRPAGAGRSRTPRRWATSSRARSADLCRGEDGLL